MRPFIVHIDIDAFFASVEAILNPSLKGKPVVVGALPGERGVVASASYEARRYGLKAGMPIGKAKKLCPHCIFLRGHFSHYEEFSNRFHKLLLNFTPIVEMASLDEAYLDLTDCSLLYPSLHDVVFTIKNKIEAELKLSVSIGVSYTKLLAKLATKRAKPGGIKFIKDENEAREFLRDLDISEIPGVGSKMIEILRRLNIKKVEELWQLSLDSLISIFGKTGEYLYFAARGLNHGVIGIKPIQKSISRETTFPRDITDPDLIRAHIYYLSDRLSVALKRDGLKTSRVELKLRFSDFNTITRRKKIIPTEDPLSIYRTALEMFLPLFEKEKRALRLVGVAAKELQKAPLLDLYTFNEKRERILNAIMRVRTRYGFSSVMAGRELILKRLYPLKRKEGFILKTASLTR